MTPSPAERLDQYVRLVESWSSRLDLVSPGDVPRFRQRHVDDALRAAPLLDRVPPGPCIDVGSGVGIPGIPLCIVGEGRPWRLLEPRVRRAAFLEEVVRSLDLDCEIITVTAEEAAQDPRLARGHVLVTARALAPPEVSARLVAPFLGPYGIGVVWLGENADVPPGAEEWRPRLAIIRGVPPTEAEA